MSVISGAIICTVKSNLTDCKVTFNSKIHENSPASGAMSQTPLYTVYFFSKNTYCVKLYFEFDCLDCFSPTFGSPAEKSLLRL